MTECIRMMDRVGNVPNLEPEFEEKTSFVWFYILLAYNSQ